MENILGQLDEYSDKMTQYMKLRDMVTFSENKNEIEINLGSTTITIVLNNLGWDKFISNFDSLFQKKLKMSEKQILISKKEILLEKFNFNVNTDFFTEYDLISTADKIKYNLPDLKQEEYQQVFNSMSWFDILQLEHNFYTDMEMAKTELIKQGIELNEPIKNWRNWCTIDKKLPPYPSCIWSRFNYPYFIEIKIDLNDL